MNGLSAALVTMQEPDNVIYFNSVNCNQSFSLQYISDTRQESSERSFLINISSDSYALFHSFEVKCGMFTIHLKTII